MPRTAAWVALVAALAACEGPAAPETLDAGDPRAAPPAPRAAIAIEPPLLRAGEVAVIEVVVVTPAGHSVPPIAPPEEKALAPLWLLDATALPTEKSGARWTHRTRLRVRAREAGSLTFPPLRIDVVGPEGARSTLETEARPIEIASVLPAYPDRVSPFPFRAPPEPAPAVPALTAAAAGALSALAAVAGVALVRRARRGARAARAEADSFASALAAAPWEQALASLDAARAEVDAEWRHAADHTQLALRHYVERRFHWPIACRTTEEIARLTPPFALAARWPAALATLRALDGLRFRPPRAERAEEVRRALDDATRWVAATIPPEAAR